MKTKLHQTDRYILIASMGVLLISLCITFDRVLKQEFTKDQIKLSQQETHKRESLNIKIWRRYHTEQMILLQNILKELKYQSDSSIWIPQNKNIKIHFQKSLSSVEK